VVPVGLGRLAYENHRRGDRPAEWHEFRMEHQVTLPEIGVIREWLHARFAKNPEERP
jgi:hypothetical protein